MRNQGYWRWAFLAALAVSATVPVRTIRGEDTWEAERVESLKGLTGVAVFISLEPGAEPERAGLRMDQLRTDMELRLRTSGVRVPNEAEWQQTPRRPRVFAKVFLLKHPIINRYSISVDLLFYQDVAIEGAPGRKCHACTWWGKQYVAATGAKEAPEEVRRVLREQLDAFINAYLSVNPK